MTPEIDHDQLDAALKRCGSSWDAAQTHGLLSGRLAVGGVEAAGGWLAQVLEGTNDSDALRAECEQLLGDLLGGTHQQLTERQSEFVLLLPDDEDSTSTRATALAHWCEGFLHGLVSLEQREDMRQRLAAEPLADIIRDLLQITRAEADLDSTDDDDAAYFELVEYVRVAVQLAYEELADLRNPDAPIQSERLH
ncbi:MAG: UPF0149 family protein [Pseudomonadota bacterium]